ncbi:hypothetical protein MTAT_19770 [Moorella thermoacetica]|uniref:Uncharacterized protein n=1 Tax=Neomoorella thermoacetica TaxID=1525 RepID=A0AAC9MVP4_NEOTH|nr:hypothetical protein [Moorella thermoacetica]AOQ24632.1 hypothetical protein Maut_02204 [Moorella thermoacetica]TYL12735.1 hypothetical protein MTAT_19770 [Moorella thermoacetica]
MLDSDLIHAYRNLAAAESRLRFVDPEYEDIALEQVLLAKKELDLALKRVRIETAYQRGNGLCA